GIDSRGLFDSIFPYPGGLPGRPHHAAGRGEEELGAGQGRLRLTAAGPRVGRGDGRDDDRQDQRRPEQEVPLADPQAHRRCGVRLLTPTASSIVGGMKTRGAAMRLSRVLYKLLLYVATVAVQGPIWFLLIWQAFAVWAFFTAGGISWGIAFCLALAATFVLFLVSMILHEVGQVLAALAMRMRVWALSLGPVQGVREQGSFRLRLNWGKSNAHFWVNALLAGGRGLRWREIGFVAGGPVASLLLALLSLALAVQLNCPPRELSHLDQQSSSPYSALFFPRSQETAL